jgi:hypothetical protein
MRFTAMGCRPDCCHHNSSHCARCIFWRDSQKVNVITSSLKQCVFKVQLTQIHSSTNTQSPNTPKSSNNGAYGTFPAYTQSGIAGIILPDRQHTPVTYVQTKNGDIIENVWSADSLSTVTFANSTQTVVARNAKQGYPIAAIAYKQNDVIIVSFLSWKATCCHVKRS